ncbi:MAG TPA: P-loop NTPase [Limnochordia bacterium]
MGTAADWHEWMGRMATGNAVVLRPGSPIYRGVYHTELMSVSDEGLRVRIPLEAGKLVLIPVGTPVSVEVYGTGEKIAFESRIVERRGGQDRCLVVGRPQEPAPVRMRPVVRTPRVGKPVIAVTSGKGGVGKTTLSVNLGLALGAAGRRVCLIDADLGTANVDVVLNLAPRYNLADVVRGEKNILETLVEGPNGLIILPGGSGLQELTEMDERQYLRLLGQFRELERYADVLIIDTGSGLSRSVTRFVLAATRAVVVTTPEPPAITDAYALIKVLSRQGFEGELLLVVNRVQSAREAEEIAAKMVFATRRFLGSDLKPLGYVMEDGAVSRAVREQVGVFTAYPRARATENIRILAERLLDVEAAKESAPSDGFARAFLQRMRGLLPGGR